MEIEKRTLEHKSHSRQIVQTKVESKTYSKSQRKLTRECLGVCERERGGRDRDQQRNRTQLGKKKRYK